jgi:hypothetical protein
MQNDAAQPADTAQRRTSGRNSAHGAKHQMRNGAKNTLNGQEWQANPVSHRRPTISPLI